MRGLARLKLKDQDEFLAEVRKAGVFSFDFETDSLDTIVARPTGLALYVPEIESRGSNEYGLWIDFRGDTMPPSTKWPQSSYEDATPLIRALFEDSSLYSLAQNYNYDAQLILQRFTRDLRAKALDTLHLARAVRPNRHSLKLSGLVKTFCGLKLPDYGDIEGDGGSAQMSLIPGRKKYLGPYSLRQVRATWRLYKALLAEADSISRDIRKRYLNIDMPLLQYMVLLQFRGIPYDRSALESMVASFAVERDAIADDLKREHGFDPATGVSGLRSFLYEALEVPMQPGKPLSKQPVKRSFLERIAGRYPAVEDIVAYKNAESYARKSAKSLEGIVAYPRIHPTYNLHGHEHSRIMCKHPIDLNGLPKGGGLRSFLIPEEGHEMIAFDYRAFGLNVLADLSSDEQLMVDCDDGPHNVIAGLFGVDRDVAKVINSGVVLGLGGYSLALAAGFIDDDGLIDESWGKRVLREWFARYPQLGRYLNIIHDRFENHGYRTTNGLGMVFDGRRRVYSSRSKEGQSKISNSLKTALWAFQVNSTAAFIFKRALLHVCRRIYKLEARLLSHNNDEIVISAPPREVGKVINLVRPIMSNVPGLLSGTVYHDRFVRRYDVTVATGENYDALSEPAP